MRILAALAMLLGSCTPAACECVTVTGPEAKPSFRNAEITVLRDGKPQENVKLIVILPNGQIFRSFVTDSHGTAMLKDLLPGIDCVTAVDEGYLRAYLCLNVSGSSNAKMSKFTVTLWVDPLYAPPALGNAPPEPLRQLDLVVLDVSGAVVPHADIQVFERRSYPENLVLKGSADEEGRFARPLDPGTYAVLVRSPGFKVAVRLIEISPEGRVGQVREFLQPGSC